MKEYNIGDKVWWAKRQAKEKFVVCPDCFGKLVLTVIMGDGNERIIECVNCAKGYEGASGYVSFWEQTTDVTEATINRVEIDAANQREYGLDGSYRVAEADIFSTKEESEIRAKELSDIHNKEEEAKLYSKEKNNRTWAWNASYYKKQIENCERQLKYYNKKLQFANKKK